MCFECEKQALHKHHVVPQVYGGTKTVDLCEECHSKIHGHDLNISELVKAKIKEKQDNQEFLGGLSAPFGYFIYMNKKGIKKLRKNKCEQNIIKLIVDLRDNEKLSFNKICQKLFLLGVLCHPRKKGRRFQSWNVRQIYLQNKKLENTK